MYGDASSSLRRPSRCFSAANAAARRTISKGVGMPPIVTATTRPDSWRRPRRGRGKERGGLLIRLLIARRIEAELDDDRAARRVYINELTLQAERLERA